jgi:poly-beta-1,6-N-acetyl-D-glucosamine synthase
MNRLHLYILLYGVLAFMIIDTILFGFTFVTSNLLYAMANITMTIFVVAWLLRAVPLLVISSFYRSYVARMKARARAVRKGKPYAPLVSVIIPAYNEQVGIVPTLKTLLASTFHSVEVLVINDGSTDATEERVLAFLRKYRQATHADIAAIQIRYYRKENGGKGSALNYGISKARGEIICTFDADCVVTKDCIERFVSYFVEPSIMACAGNIKIANQQTTIGIMQYLEYLMAFRMKQAEAMLGVVLVIGGAASAFRKSVFDTLNGYDTRMLTEDMEMSFRIQRAGMRIFYAHDAMVYTEGPSTWKGLRKQRVRWKRGRVETMHAYRSSVGSTLLTNRVFFWMVMPLVYWQDIEFLLSAPFTVVMYVWCLASFNFTPTLAALLLTGSLYALLFAQDRSTRIPSLLCTLPISWFLSHCIVFIESYALIMAYLTFWTKREVLWQKWDRQGAIERK